MFNLILSLFLSITGGFLYALGFPNDWLESFLPGPILGLTCLFVAWGFFSSQKINLKRKILNLIAFSLSAYFVAYLWIPYTIEEFGNIQFPLNYILGTFFSLIIFPQLWVILFCSSFLNKFIPKKLNEKISTTPSLQVLITTILITTIEYFTPQQFPAHLGHPFLSLAPYLALAPVFGLTIYSFIGHWIVLNFCYFIQKKKILIFAWPVITILLIFSFVFPLQKHQGETKEIYTRIVQGNIGSLLKMNIEQGQGDLLNWAVNEYKELTLRPSKKPLDLIIWPETAFPHILSAELMFENSQAIPSALKKIVETTQAELFFGSYDHKFQESIGVNEYFETDYNAAFLLGKNGLLKNIFRKHMLIPFGETLPFGPLTPILGQYIQNISYFAKGKEFTLFKLDNGIPFSAAICYEILFTDFIRNYLNSLSENPQFLINLTNDSWYGDSAEVRQHLFLAKWRALEFNLPIIRSTNTGISTVIYPDGSEGPRLGLGEKNNLDLEFQFGEREKTLYQQFGFLSILALWILLLLGAFLSKTFLQKIMKS